VEASESYEESLRRELFEELNLTVKIKRPFKNAIHHNEENPIELISFICTTEDTMEESTDHEMREWVKVEKLLSRKLAPTNVAIAQQLLDEYLSVLIPLNLQQRFATFAVPPTKYLGRIFTYMRYQNFK